MTMSKNKKFNFIDFLMSEARELTTFNFLVSYSLTTRDTLIEQEDNYRKGVAYTAYPVVNYYKKEKDVLNNIIELPAMVASQYMAFFALEVSLTSFNYSGFIFSYVKGSRSKKNGKYVPNLYLEVYQDKEIVGTLTIKGNSDTAKLIEEYMTLFEKQLAPARERINKIQLKLLAKIVNLIKKHLI